MKIKFGKSKRKLTVPWGVTIVLVVGVAAGPSAARKQNVVRRQFLKNKMAENSNIVNWCIQVCVKCANAVFVRMCIYGTCALMCECCENITSTIQSKTSYLFVSHDLGYCTTCKKKTKKNKTSDNVLIILTIILGSWTNMSQLQQTDTWPPYPARHRRWVWRVDENSTDRSGSAYEEER